jgi:2-phospho-L-lactate/phosphoenolpyruvate guanylyltransferase
MTTLAIVPVKPFHEGKSRLDGVLTDIERYHLNAQLLRKTIGVLSNIKAIERIIVISRDPEVLEMSRDLRAFPLPEVGEGLNQALYQVNNTLDKVSDRVLVIPTDLPLLSEEDVIKVMDKGKVKPVVVVVPDRHQKGTNALLVNPVGSIRYRFGSNSAKKHATEAQKRNINTIIMNIPGISFDLDLIEDWALLKSTGYLIPVQIPDPMEETVI